MLYNRFENLEAVPAVVARSAEYGIFGQDLKCVNGNCPMRRCAQAGILVCVDKFDLGWL